jgi:hypothetical protein
MAWTTRPGAAATTVATATWPMVAVVTARSRNRFVVPSKLASKSTVGGNRDNMEDMNEHLDHDEASRDSRDLIGPANPAQATSVSNTDGNSW